MRCCVRGCLNLSRDTSDCKKITFHSFPTVATYRSAWLRALGKTEGQIKDSEKVCSEHFTKKDLYKTRTGLTKVKTGAVPTCALEATTDENHVQSQLLKICRLCLNIKCNLFSITKYKLEDVFENLTGLSMTLEDGLPYMLCAICAYKLQKYDSFRRSCIQTNNVMIDLLKNSENVSILESIKHTKNYENEPQISTKIDSYDLIITEFDDKQTNIDDNTEQDNFNIHDEDLIYAIKSENLNTKDVIVEDILPVEYEDTEAENDNDNNSTVENNSDIKYQFDSNSIKLELIQEPKEAVEETKQIEKQNKIKREKDKPKRAKYKPNTDLTKELFTVDILTIEEQIAEIEIRKLTDNYKKAAFKCDICFKGFYYLNAYNNHMFKHSNECGQYECDICKIRFDKYKAVRSHKMAAHIHKFSCKECKFVTTHTSTARHHEKWHKGIKYSCPHCTEVFDKATSYMSHVRVQHPSDFVCGLCGYSFISAKGIELHKKLKHRGDDQVIPSDGPYCESCNVRFATDEAYRKHLSISQRHVNGEDKVRNEPIKRIGVKRKKVKNEVTDEKQTKIMKCEEPIPCEQCGLQLEDFTAYYLHFRKTHPDKNRTKFPSIGAPCMCEVCGRIFQTIALLKDHSWVHTSERPFKCEQCGKSFRMRQRLVVHKEIHSAATHVCDLCGKRFNNPSNLRRHKTYVHSDLKPFKCELCDKDFKSLPEKRSHFNYVHMKKPWPNRNRNRRKTQPASQTESDSD